MNINPDGLSSDLFTISYAGRELSCLVERNDDILDILIDNDLQTRLQLESDGRLHHLFGHVLPDSTLAFIYKEVVQKMIS